MLSALYVLLFISMVKAFLMCVLCFSSCSSSGTKETKNYTVSASLNEYKCIFQSQCEAYFALLHLQLGKVW